jgi:hypothetical protein
MRPCCVVACLVLVSCLASPCFAEDGETAAPQPLQLEWLSRSRASLILENGGELSNSLARQIKSPRNADEAKIVEEIRDSLTDPSNWRWHYRDHGLLLGIPVNERLGMLSSYYGEKVLADIVRRLINQKGWGNPRVQVVFVEPQLTPPAPRYGVQYTDHRDVGLAECFCP